METIQDSILQDHEHMREIMKRMTSAKASPNEREEAFKELEVELKAHAGAEERYFYSPVLMNDKGLEKTRHATYEHEEAEEIVDEIKKLNPKGKAFKEKTKELAKTVKHHMEEEEGEYFKISNKILSTNEKKQLDEQYRKDYERLKKKYAKAS